MIKCVEVQGVNFTIDFEAFKEEPETWDDPGCDKYMEFNSVKIIVGEAVIDIWACLSEQTLENIEEQLWKSI